MNSYKTENLDLWGACQMSKQKMLAAKELIREKHFDEARNILKTINHPTAKEWLAKLDKIAPEKKKASFFTPPIIYYLGGGVVGLLIIIVAVIFMNRPTVFNQSSSSQSTESNSDVLTNNIPSSGLLTETYIHSGVTIKHPIGWQTTATNSQIMLSSKDMTIVENANDLTPDTHAVFIGVEREIGANDTPLSRAQETQDSLKKGYTSSEGEVLQAPIQPGPIVPINIGSYSGVVFEYEQDGIPVKAIYIDSGNRTISSFVSTSGDVSAFNPIFTEMISTYSFDVNLAGDFACPARVWDMGFFGEDIRLGIASTLW